MEQSSKSKILVLGSLAYDYIMKFDEFFTTNLTVNSEKKQFNLALMPSEKSINFGGTAGNISYNINQLKHENIIITSVGKDFINLGYQSYLKQFPTTEFKGTIHKDEFTASAYIVNDKGHNQLIIFHQGALLKSVEISLKEIEDIKKDVRIATVSPDFQKAMMKWANELFEMKIPFIFDPGQVTPAFTKDMLLEIIPKAHIVIGNEFEIKMICDKIGVSLEKLLEINPNLIRTLGEKGVECYYQGEYWEIPACKPSEIKDTTGAGDAFRAGLLVALVHNIPIQHACKIGAAVSSLAIETIGAQTQKFNKDDLMKRIEENYRQKIQF